MGSREAEMRELYSHGKECPGPTYPTPSQPGVVPQLPRPPGWLQSAWRTRLGGLKVDAPVLSGATLEQRAVAPSMLPPH